MAKRRDDAGGTAGTPGTGPDAQVIPGVVTPGTWNPKTRTLDVVISTGAIVRWRDMWGDEWDEELVVTPDAVDLRRANAGAPFLLQHRTRDPNALLGAWVQDSVRVEGREVVGRVQFVPEELAVARGVESYIQEIASGFRPNVSAGYRDIETQLIERSGQVPLQRVTRWELTEGSSVNVPADNDAGYRARSTERRSMSTRNAPAAPAAAPENAATPENGAGTDDTELTPAQRAAEETRIKTIEDLAKRRGLSADHDLVREAIRTGMALDGDRGFRARLLDLDASQSAGTATSPHHRAEFGVDEQDKLIDAMATAVCHRAAPHLVKLEGPNDWRHRTLADMGRELAARRGQNLRGAADTDVAEAMCGLGARARAHGPGDFVHLMANVASKMVMAAGRSTPVTYDRVAARRTLANFKNDKIVILPALPDLDKMAADNQPIRYVTFSDAGVNWRGFRYTSGFAAGPEAIVNDDQEALAEYPMKATVAAYRTRNGAFWTTVLASTFNSVALFHADHGNLAGAGVAASAAGIDSLEKLAAAQQDQDGNPIDTPLAILLTGAHNRLALGQLLDKTNRSSDSAKNLPAGQDYELVFERRLTGTAYYALTPIGENGLLYGVVRGYEEPKVSVQTDFDTGGVKFKVEDSFAAVCAHPRGVYKQPGV